MRALIVDDSAVMRKVIERALRQAGLELSEVLQASNGEEALQTLRENQAGSTPLALILSDINMPVMDGWDFMEHYVKIKPQMGKKIIVYMVSSSINDEDILRAKAIADISDYIIKPVSPERLIELFALAA